MSRLIRNSRGATLIEAAIITPLLLLLTFAIVDFAGLFYCYLALENGASQATRYAITGNVVSGSSREDSIKSAMRAATGPLGKRRSIVASVQYACTQECQSKLP